MDQRGRAAVLVYSFRSLHLHVEQAKLNSQNSSNSGREEGTRERKIRGEGERKNQRCCGGKLLLKAEWGSGYGEGKVNGEYSVQLY